MGGGNNHGGHRRRHRHFPHHKRRDKENAPAAEAEAVAVEAAELTEPQDIPEDNITEAPPAPAPELDPSVPSVEIVGINFREAGKIYYFAPDKLNCKVGDKVIVETSRGIEMGTVKVANKKVPASEIVPPLKNVTRIATEDDIERDTRNHELELDAAMVCKKKIAAQTAKNQLTGKKDGVL